MVSYRCHFLSGIHDIEELCLPVIVASQVFYVLRMETSIVNRLVLRPIFHDSRKCRNAHSRFHWSVAIMIVRLYSNVAIFLENFESVSKSDHASTGILALIRAALVKFPRILFGVSD